MELNERKTKILEAIIRTYLDTGEPVGSRTISKYADLSLSPATIRNEMSDLEEMGYILQPHTSSGRIPSDKGYRFYVDRLFQDKEREVADMHELVVQKADQLSELLRQVAKLLAQNTNYAAMISAPQIHRNKLKFIQLSRVDADQILAVIVVEGNIIKNKMIHVDGEMSDETILKLNLLLNTH
nr:heat-inducible transcriptional repressor HrcA [Lachnospiraceae bacterium]